MPDINSFRIVDDFYLWEAYQGINNARTIDQFRIVDNYYLYLAVLAFVTSDQAAIQFQDEGFNLGTAGTADVVNFEGSGVTAVRVGNTITITIPGAAVAIWEPGTGLESAQLINTTIFPNSAGGDHSIAAGANNSTLQANSFVSGFNSLSGGINSFVYGNSNVVMGDDAAALGGNGNFIDAGSPRSVALGGVGNNIFGESDIAQAQNLRITTDLRINQGANKPVGTSAAMVAGTAVVPNTIVKAGAIILLTHETPAGVIGILSAPLAGITPGVSFTINSSLATDISTVNYLIINP